MGELLLIRHGRTEWSAAHRHTGRTDVPLTPEGEEQARSLRPLLAGRPFARVLTSPLVRASHTADLAGLTGAEAEPDLMEWDYGGYEGITTADIRTRRPGWYLWRDGVVPGDAEHPGETVEEVGARADRVLARVAPLLADPEAGDVALVGHGHQLRVLTARRLGLPPDHGRLFRLDTAAVGRLGLEHDRPVLTAWNLAPE
ncbi:histidine phosphatase family protein [Streptomonospora sp. S1-112]|uniref:Histidine phosphatase family protein n=1 Tax=Streptomonospora mangrovi TaxID=2883123 RepID=A0A9X3NQS9_9ACTN|nr:histidine phosphatase family protein [Streptomonospora mangrovi]MDA0565085.1 histidine phosphatase family protein [Streptomonospora mangrovi]